MNWQAIIQVISSLGFPIVMCLLMYKRDTDTIEKLRSVVEANTLATNKLIQAIGGIHDES